MAVEVSVVKDKKDRKVVVGSIKHSRYAAANDFISRKYRNISAYISPGNGTASVYEFPRRLVRTHQPSHRGARTSLSPRHR